MSATRQPNLDPGERVPGDESPAFRMGQLEREGERRRSLTNDQYGKNISETSSNQTGQATSGATSRCNNDNNLPLANRGASTPPTSSSPSRLTRGKQGRASRLERRQRRRRRTPAAPRPTPRLAKLTMIIIGQMLPLLLALLLWRPTQAYNLDYQKALLKRGPAGSYFGYSIAQHETFDEWNRNASFQSSVIVGAPRDQPRTALGVQRPGAIYKCDFSRAEKCQLVELEPSINLASGPSAAAIYAAESAGLQPSGSGFVTAAGRDPLVQRDDQWLGVSVKSQGANGYAVACAHRQVLKGPNYRWPQGICYSMTRNLTLHRTWQPCLNRPVNKAHEEYGFCQAGTSVDISASSDIVLGAPGPYTWRGTVFSNSITFGAKDDRTWYMAPVQDEEARVHKYSYLGMSLITGHFFNGREYYVSGAPRSNDAGQVLVMTKQVVNGRRGADSALRTEQVLDGKQMASAFGYALAKLDFNADGRPDLAVAAPFYYNRSQGGQVYLYSNNGKSFEPAGELSGRPESRFGFALANCGDLNHDKFEDLAVGAPYEQPGGAVYIYLGSAHGIKSRPAQVIRAAAAQTFGYSLSGGLDMDRNGYPDLVVGSYADDSVYILRGRPIIEIATKIEGNLSRIDPNRTTCDGERAQMPCFKFNTCFELDPSKIGEYSDSMKLKYRIEAETFTGQKYSRVKFHDSDISERPNVVEREITIDDYQRATKKRTCNTQRVYLKDRSDVQTPIQFKLDYTLVPADESGKSAPAGASRFSASNQLISYTASSSSSYSNLYSSTSGSAPASSSSLLSTLPASSSASSPSSFSTNEHIPAPFPILNQEEAQRIFSAKFLKDCGANDICESHIDVDGSLQMPRETLGVNEPGYPSDKQVNVTIRVANNNEPAYEARLFVSHPANLLYTGFKPIKQVSLVECVSLERNLVKCELGNPMPKGSTKLLMIFNTQNQAGTFDFNLMVNTTSQNNKDARTSYDLSGTIKRKLELQMAPKQPPVYPEPAMQEPPLWLILLSVLLGLLLFSALFYCLYVNGFFDRPKARYTAANTEDRFN